MEIVASAGLHDTIPKLIASCSPHAAWHGCLHELLLLLLSSSSSSSHCSSLFHLSFVGVHSTLRRCNDSKRLLTLSLRWQRRIWLNGRAATAPFGQSTEGMTKSVMALQERGLS